MLDIVKRAVTGIGRSPRGGRPRGVAFLAGPTGVGKTELAKTITSLLFGDESAYIRFDMSEFSAEHADQRLIGAPRVTSDTTLAESSRTPSARNHSASSYSTRSKRPTRGYWTSFCRCSMTEC
jgi:hypothetical protein